MWQDRIRCGCRAVWPCVCLRPAKGGWGASRTQRRGVGRGVRTQRGLGEVVARQGRVQAHGGEARLWPFGFDGERRRLQDGERRHARRRLACQDRGVARPGARQGGGFGQGRARKRGGLVACAAPVHVEACPRCGGAPCPGVVQRNGGKESSGFQRRRSAPAEEGGTGHLGYYGGSSKAYGGRTAEQRRKKGSATMAHRRLVEEGLGAVARCGRDDSKQCRAALLRRRIRTGAPAWWRSVAIARRRGAPPPRFLPWRGGGRAPPSSSCVWCQILLAWRDGGVKLLLPFLASPPGFSPSSLAWSASSVSRWWRRRRRLGRRGRRLGFAASDWGVI